MLRNEEALTPASSTSYGHNINMKPYKNQIMIATENATALNFDQRPVQCHMTWLRIQRASQIYLKLYRQQFQIDWSDD